MILLITPSLEGQECAAAIEKATGELVEFTKNLRQGCQRLRNGEFSVVVIDQGALEQAPEIADVLLEQSGTAFPVYVNFAIWGRERVVREVKLGLTRRRREDAIALKSAIAMLRNQLKGELTGILLSSELVLANGALPEPVEVNVRSVHELAKRMRARLEA